jgi:DNA processing protein
VSDRRAEERLARAALTRVAEPAEPAIVRAVVRQGALTTWDQVRSGAQVPGVSGDLMAAVRARLPHDPRRDLEVLERVGGRFLIPGDDEWPDRLGDLGERLPIGLWVCGPASLVDTARSVAIVGSRAATSYGDHVASDLGYDLTSRGWLVVSGGAYGIDGAAHRGALAAEGETIAVLACGVDVAYPRGHERLFDRIRATGAIVSEWPPGCAPMRHRFLTRNRVIAAMTSGTVVVEAGARSGARTTAKEARLIDRPLMAVPGPVTSALSVGCHQMLRQEGVRCVTSAAEIIEELGRIGELAPLPRGAVGPRDDLSPQLRRVLEAVPKQRGATPEAIARTAGISPLDVRLALAQLVAAGFVVMAPGGWRLAGGRTSDSARPSLFDD